MLNWIELTRDGVRTEGDDGGVAVLVPRTTTDLLGFWHWTIREIDPEYTLGDLLALLRGVDDVGHLSALLGCDLPQFLAEGALPRTVSEDCLPDFVEVFNEAEPTTYAEDSADPDVPDRFLDGDEAEQHDSMMAALHDLIGEPALPRIRVYADDDDPITGRPVARRFVPGSSNGTWAGPYCIHRGFRGWRQWREPHPGFFAAHPGIDPAKCIHGITLELIPVNELAHCPLRYNPEIAFGDDEAAFRDRITITFGELVHAVFAVLGLAGTPGVRDEHRTSIMLRAAEIEADILREMGEADGWR